MPRIFDNIDLRLLDALRSSMQVAHRADFCVGYFNLRGWRHLDCYIEPWSGTEDNRCRLLVGMHKSPKDTLSQLFSLTNNGEAIDRGQVVRSTKQLAEDFRTQLTLGTPSASDEAGLRRLANQLKAGKLVVKLFLRHALHAKLYLTYRHDIANPRTGYVGSSNLTFSGIEGNGELNVDVLDHDASQKLADWFEDRWQDPFCIDISQALVSVIEESWAREDLVPPYHIYVKMAYHLALEAREGLRRFDIPEDFADILFPYQSAAVKIAAHHLVKRGGVLIGDVVGLGKTLMATAIARLMEELEGTSTLIICPKNLERMWQSYVDAYGLRARVMPISVVQRQLADIPARFRLVLIDESHNLRNPESKRYAAIREYIRQSNSRVILLSATPYNKSYLDLSSQLSLFVDASADLGIRPDVYVRELGGDANFNAEHSQTAIRSLAAFEKSTHADDWRELMRLFLVRRTRSFIKENYAQVDPQNNRRYLAFADGSRAYFPDRLPKAITFDMNDDNPQDQYARLYADAVVDIVNSLTLPRYGLGNYISERPKQPANPDEAQQLANLSRAGKRLMGFSRTNMFKRLESSGYAFLLTLERHVLRNYIYAYAIENGVDLPIGTQEAELLDTRNFDEDSDATGSARALFDSEDDSNEPLPDIEALWTEEAFIKRAAEIYQSYRAQYHHRFKWIRPSLFTQQLQKNLLSDARKLTEVLQLAGAWDADQDVQLAALITLLTKKHPSEKVLIFSQFADTVRYLGQQLKVRGVTQAATVSGQTSDPTSLVWRFSPNSNGKREVIAPEEELRVLVATDVLSEGQNLQDAHIVVNYDLPWAIIRLIQRAGRVDRIGQQSHHILVYTFLPAEGIERIIHLRERVRQRLRENAEVVGTDESFFEEEASRETLIALYNEKAGLLEDDADGEVDLASQAYQIWQNAIEANPRLEHLIPNLPNVIYGTRQHTPSEGKPNGVLVYMQTAQGNDALAWVDEQGNSVTESQVAILKAAECAPDTEPLARLEHHHHLVEKGVDFIVQENRSVGGQLGRRTGARYRVYNRLENYYNDQRGSLFETPILAKVIAALYGFPLYQSAINILNRKLKQGVSNQELAELCIALHEDDRLCIIHEETTKSEPKIICSMGLAKGA